MPPPLCFRFPQVVEGFNRDPSVHGILVQLPLPAHVSETRILDAISIEKDVDGFSPANVGALAMRGREPLYVSCTPKVRASTESSLLLLTESPAFGGSSAAVPGVQNGPHLRGWNATPCPICLRQAMLLG